MTSRGLAYSVQIVPAGSVIGTGNDTEIGLWSSVLAVSPSQRPLMIREKANGGPAAASGGAVDSSDLREAMTQLHHEARWLRAGAYVGATFRRSIEMRLCRMEQALAAVTERLTERSPQDTWTPRQPGFGGAVRHAGVGPATALTILQQADQAHGDALLVLDSAFATAAETQCGDPDRLRAVLGALSCIARHRQLGVLEVSVREALAELGIESRSGGPDADACGIDARLHGRRDDPVPPLECVLADSGKHPLCIHLSSRCSSDSRLVIVYVGRRAPTSVLLPLARRIG